MRAWALLFVAGCAPPGPEVGPTVRSVVLGPDAATVQDVLVATVDAEPADAVELTWAIDGSVVQRGPSTTLDAGFVKHDVVTVTAVATRGGLAGASADASLEIADAPPVMLGAATITPALPRALLTDLVCVPPDVSDPDGDAVSWRFTWTVDGAPVDDVDGDTVPAAVLAVDEVWACTAWVSDGEVEVAADPVEVRVDVGARPGFGVPVAGPVTSCALDADGAPRCWGWDGDERLASPPSGPFARLWLGGGFGCALRVDDLGLSCWGGEDARSRPPDGPFVEAALGEAHGCAARPDGEVVCWGWDGEGQASPPAGPLHGLVAGASTTCALDADDHPRCWGADVGVDALGDAVLVELAVGAEHVCGRTPEGELVCAGRGSFGETSPPPGAYAAVAARAGETCAATVDGEVVCFGVVDGRWDVGATTLSMSLGAAWCARTADGGAVCGSTDVSRQPSVHGEDVAPTERWAAFGLEDRLMCGLDAGGRVGCVGVWGALGRPEVPLDALAVGSDVACGLRSADRHPVCWGWLDRAGLVGEPDEALTDVAVGDGFACGLLPDGRATCWGERAPLPPEVAFSSLDAAADWACGQMADGLLRCFGADDDRALPPAGSYTAFDLARRYGCGLRPTGRLVCWGPDAPPDDPGPWTAVAAADDRVCALDVRGRPRCWEAASAPVGLLEPDAPVRLVELAGGVDRVCGRRADGAVFCWGAVRRQPLP